MNVQEYHEVIKFNNRICRFVDRMILNREATKDIVQDAYLKLWETKENVQFQAALSWLFTTSYRLTLLFLQKNKRLVNADQISDPITFQPSSDASKIIEGLLQNLPELQRSIILLRDYEGYSYEEIGEILKINESQVKVYLFRARKRLKDIVKDLNLVI